MKKKYLAAILGIMMATASVTACGAATTETTTNTAESSDNKGTEDTTAESAESTEDSDSSADADKEDSDEEDVTYGEVKSVEDGKITIAVGTMKDMGGNGGAPEKPDENGSGDASADTSDAESTESDSKDAESDKTDSKDGDSTDNGEAPEKPDGDNADGNGGAPGGDQGEAPSMLDLTGDEMTVTVTDDTVITKESAEGPGGAPGGNQGEAPEKSDGDNGNGETPEKPENDNTDGDSTSTDSTESDSTDIESNKTDSETESSADDSAAPEKPDGDSTDGNDQGQVPEKPDGDNGNNQAPGGDQGGAPDGNNSQSETIELSDIQEGDIVAITTDDDGNAYVKGGTVTTDAAGGAGLFAYGDGTVYAADTTIKTTQDTSGGIHAAGGGKLYAWDLNVETDGESAAAIRSDRGGGTMVVDGGTYTSNGVGSPAVYCTADIAVKDATLTANGSEAVCIEGLNSLHLFNCDLTGNMSDLSQNDSTWTVILYQSMSGDSEVGNSTFQMDGGTLTSKNGGVFYTTNTESDITLKDVDITYNNDNEYFLRCTGNNNERGWGESGANGADCDFTAISQDMEGSVIWDTISQLDFYMTDGSNLTGAIIDDESFAGNGGDGYCNVYVSDDSTWTVTGDSTVSKLSNAGTIVDDSGKTVTVKGTDGTVYVEGDSDYTITVDKYEDTADTSGSDTVASWSDYEVEKPDTL